MRDAKLILYVAALLILFAACGEQKDSAPKEIPKDTVIKAQEPEDTQSVIDPQYKTKANDTIVASAEHPRYQISIKQGKYSFGDLTIELFPDVAPLHCRNFDSLVSIRFYDGLAFHRVVGKQGIGGLFIQGGDPNSRDKPEETWGLGDPSQTTVPAELNKLKHVRGMISAARNDNMNGANSQFFIVLYEWPQIDGKYTVFGRVVDGIDVAEQVAMVDVKPSPAMGGEPCLPVKKITMKIRKL